MENIIIRKVLLNEVLQLQEISRVTFFETFAKDNSEEDMRYYLENNFSEQQLNAELNNKDAAFYFALVNEKVVGYLKLNTELPPATLASVSAIEIARIYVLQPFHGKKVGQLLFEKALAIAHQQQADYLWLGVWEHNPRAIHFYKKNGFEEFGTQEFILGNDIQTDILMKLKVG